MGLSHYAQNLDVILSGARKGKIAKRFSRRISLIGHFGFSLKGILRLFATQIRLMPTAQADIFGNNWLNATVPLFGIGFNG